jgi:hypothetical protein
MARSSYCFSGLIHIGGTPRVHRKEPTMSDASLPRCPTCLIVEYSCVCPPCPRCSSDWDDSNWHCEYEIRNGVPFCTSCNVPMRGYKKFMQERAELQQDRQWFAEEAQRRRIKSCP